MPRFLCIFNVSLLLFAALCSTSLAGTKAKKSIKKKSSKSKKTWCSWISKKPGVLYKNKKNPYVQELKVFGRFHWQYAYVDGEGSEGSGTRKFNYDTEEIRRFRIGSKLKFLNYFEANASVNFSEDLSPLGGARELGYVNLYSAYLTMDVRKAFDIDAIDELEIRVGKEKTSPSEENEISSRFIKTVERSSLSNFISPDTATGLFLSAEKDRWNFDLGVSSGDFEREFTKFDNGYFYNLRVSRRFKNLAFADRSTVAFRVFINGDEKQNSTKNPYSLGTFNQKWVTSLGSQSKLGRFELLTDLVFGDNGQDFRTNKKGQQIRNPEREGTFWGFVVMPSYWIVEDQLETVFRYQYAQASKKEGFRIAARYARVAGEVGGFRGPNDLSNGRGDRHHSAYLGLNYYICGQNAKIMTGIQYDDFNSGSQNVYAGTTIWAAFRMYF